MHIAVVTVVESPPLAAVQGNQQEQSIAIEELRELFPLLGILDLSVRQLHRLHFSAQDVCYPRFTPRKGQLSQNKIAPGWTTKQKNPRIRDLVDVLGCSGK